MIQDLVADLITYYVPTECRVKIELESLVKISVQLVAESFNIRYCDRVWQAELKTENGEEIPG